MQDYINQLDAVLASGGRKLLSGADSVSHKQAFAKAQTEYRKFQVQTLSPVEEAYLETVKGLEKTGRKRAEKRSDSFQPAPECFWRIQCRFFPKASAGAAL